MVIDFTAERRAREEEARTAQARIYLLNAAATAISVCPQMMLDFMPDQLPEELTEAHILKLERDRT